MFNTKLLTVSQWALAACFATYLITVVLWDNLNGNFFHENTVLLLIFVLIIILNHCWFFQLFLAEANRVFEQSNIRKRFYIVCISNISAILLMMFFWMFRSDGFFDAFVFVLNHPNFVLLISFSILSFFTNRPKLIHSDQLGTLHLQTNNSPSLSLLALLHVIIFSTKNHTCFILSTEPVFSRTLETSRYCVEAPDLTKDAFIYADSNVLLSEKGFNVWALYGAEYLCLSLVIMMAAIFGQLSNLQVLKIIFFRFLK